MRRLLYASVFAAVILASCENKPHSEAAQADKTFEKDLAAISDLSASNPDSAVALSSGLLASESDQGRLAKIYQTRGNAYHVKGDQEKAMADFKQAVDKAAAVRDSATLASALSDLGIVYRISGHSDSALACYQRGLAIFDKLDEPRDHSYLLTSVAVLFANKARMEDAIPYARQAYAMAKRSKDTEAIMYAGATLGAILHLHGNMEEGLDVEREMVRMAEAKGEARYILKTYAAIIDMFYKSGQRDSMNHYMQLGNECLTKLPEGSVEAMGFMEESFVVLTAQGRYRESLDIQHRMLKMKGAATFMPIQKLYQRMGRNYAGLGDAKAAEDAYETSIAMTDSVHALEVEKQLSEFDVKYEASQKEAAILKLEAEKARQRTVLIAGIAVAVFVISALIIFFVTRARKRQREEGIRRIKAELQGIEKERGRLARELHDGVCNDLLGIALLIQSPGSDKDDMLHSIETIRNEVRSISHDLMPPRFNNVSLTELLRHIADTSAGAISFIAKPTDGQEPALREEVEYELYRIVQELVSNIRKHSDATAISITYHADNGKATLCISDNATTAPLDNKDRNSCRPGIGLSTTSQRIKAIGATVENEHTDKGNSTVIVIRY